MGFFQSHSLQTEHSACTVLEKSTVNTTYKGHFSAGFENSHQNLEIFVFPTKQFKIKQSH